MFVIHPTDLRRRRARCKPIIDSLDHIDIHADLNCNICKTDRCAIIANTDRYGFKVRTAMCLTCGLIFVVDQFSDEGYATFYGAGHYRDLISQFKGKAQSIDHIEQAQSHYAISLAKTFQGHPDIEKGGTLLDIGGSTGLVALEFAKRFGHEAIVLEPAVQEAEKARSYGLETVTDTFENWETTQRFNLILLCRTIEHVFDFDFTLKKIRELLEPDGLFYCDIAEFIEICRQEGPPTATTKVDHCYWLTQETAPNIFRHYGFDIVSIQTTLPANQLGFLLRASQPQPIVPLSEEWSASVLRQFRATQADWFAYGRQQPFGWQDAVKRRLYALKKRLAKRL